MYVRVWADNDDDVVNSSFHEYAELIREVWMGKGNRVRREIE